jgi:threonyl-tRNA synthetase
MSQPTTPSDLFKKRHSLAHVLLMAIKHHFPHALPTIGPVTDTGFYYDIDFRNETKIGNEDLAKVEKTMREIIAKNLSFRVETIDTGAAEGLFT